MKQTNSHLLSVLGLACAATFAATPVKAEEDELFHIGGSCAALAYTSSSDLADLLYETYSDDLGSFCVPEEPMECSDYSPLLKGRGRLVTGEDGYHCTLHLVGR